MKVREARKVIWKEGKEVSHELRVMCMRRDKGDAEREERNLEVQKRATERKEKVNESSTAGS